MRKPGKYCITSVDVDVLPEALPSCTPEPLQISGSELMPLVVPSLQARIILDSPKLPAKLPRSAYQLWMKQAGPDILSRLGGTFDNVGQRSTALSAEWKKVSEEEKARCEDCCELSALYIRASLLSSALLLRLALIKLRLSGGEILKAKRPGMTYDVLLVAPTLSQHRPLRHCATIPCRLKGLHWILARATNPACVCSCIADITLAAIQPISACI